MRVNEIFYSVQGEGTGIGKPSVFLRLSGCNLNCVWCDSQYHKEGTEMTTDKVYNTITAGWDVTNIVITGGEPLLQMKDVTSLADRLVAFEKYIEIETNGTIEPSDRLFELGTTGTGALQFNVSPKLGSSGMKKFLNKEVLQKYNSRHVNSFFKFVIADDKDYNETLALITELSLLPNKIIFMPEGVSEERIMERTRWLIEKLKADGLDYRIIPRLHILLYGNQRGK